MKIRLILIFSLLIFSCSNDSFSDLVDVNTTINFKWNKAYEDDSIEQAIIGLKWSLSYLGATLPSGDVGFSESNSIITIDIIKLGFNPNAEQYLLDLITILKSTDEYEVNNND